MSHHCFAGAWRQTTDHSPPHGCTSEVHCTVGHAALPPNCSQAAVWTPPGSTEPLYSWDSRGRQCLNATINCVAAMEYVDRRTFRTRTATCFPYHQLEAPLFRTSIIASLPYFYIVVAGTTARSEGKPETPPRATRAVGCRRTRPGWRRRTARPAP